MPIDVAPGKTISDGGGADAWNHATNVPSRANDGNKDTWAEKPSRNFSNGTYSSHLQIDLAAAYLVSRVHVAMTSGQDNRFQKLECSDDGASWADSGAVESSVANTGHSLRSCFEWIPPAPVVARYWRLTRTRTVVGLTNFDSLEVYEWLVYADPAPTGFPRRFW